MPAEPTPIIPEVFGDTARGPWADSLRARRDTIQPALTHAYRPHLVGVGPEYLWDRDALYASGAVTLLDLLDRIPGVTALRARWLAAPGAAAYLGDFSRIRIFLDGVELDPIDPASGGVFDVNDVPFFSLEEVAVERIGGELIVHCRTWRVERVTPSTRIDVFTGDEETNIYRGFYGKRFSNGVALQLAGQQFSTQPERGIGGDGDRLSIFGRVGWASRRWSADAVVLRTSPSFSGQGRTIPSLPALAPFEHRRTDAYVRGGWNRPGDGAWAQLIAATSIFDEERRQGPLPPGGGTDTAAAPGDVHLSRAQYVATVGLSGWGLDLVATERVRVFEGETFHAPSLRLSAASRLAEASLLADWDDLRDRRRVALAARLTPVSFVTLAGTAGYETADTGAVEPALYGRAELGLRLWGLWLSGGAIVRDALDAGAAAPLLFDPNFARVAEERATGLTASARGTIWRALKADAFVVAWDSVGPYRPQVQSRSNLYLETRWLSRFPRGNFGVLAGVRHEYRSDMPVPLAGGGFAVAEQSHVVSTLVEIRIVDAIISWQFRNILGIEHETVPGFAMPRQLNLYGVRWNFWN